MSGEEIGGRFVDVIEDLVVFLMNGAFLHVFSFLAPQVMSSKIDVYHKGIVSFPFFRIHLNHHTASCSPAQDKIILNIGDC